MRTLDRRQLESVEIIDPCLREPWYKPAFEYIEVDIDQERARQKARVAMSELSLVVSTDGSAIGTNLGAAAVMLDCNGNISRVKQAGVGSNQKWTGYCARPGSFARAVATIA